MQIILPTPLKKGDTIAIISPSYSLSTVNKTVLLRAVKILENLGLNVVFSKNCYKNNIFSSSSIENRINDLQDAFTNKKIKAVIAGRGGYNCNQLLKYIDWNIIKNNPKIFCGFSDITVLSNAIFAQTGLITYSGPNFTTFGKKYSLEYTINYFQKCLFNKTNFNIEPSSFWNDNKQQTKNQKYLVINEGAAIGIILGGNLCSFNLLQGTKYFPDLTNSVLFLEEDELAKEDTLIEFDRNLESIIQQPTFNSVKGIVLGRFQMNSKVTNKKIIAMIKAKKELSTMPVIANVNFGHTDPIMTFPIGGKVKIVADKKNSTIEIIR